VLKRKIILRQKGEVFLTFSTLGFTVKMASYDASYEANVPEVSLHGFLREQKQLAHQRLQQVILLPLQML